MFIMVGQRNKGQGILNNINNWLILVGYFTPYRYGHVQRPRVNVRTKDVLRNRYVFKTLVTLIQAFHIGARIGSTSLK